MEELLKSCWRDKRLSSRFLHGSDLLSRSTDNDLSFLTRKNVYHVDLPDDNEKVFPLKSFVTSDVFSLVFLYFNINKIEKLKWFQRQSVQHTIIGFTHYLDAVNWNIQPSAKFLFSCWNFNSNLYPYLRCTKAHEEPYAHATDEVNVPLCEQIHSC